MHQKRRCFARPLVGLLSFIALGQAHAQVQQIDFQVIHLPRKLAAADHYVAIRTPEAWAALWPDLSKVPKAPPIFKIDFKHFILLIANTGVKPSSGYMNIFESVETAPASITGPPSSKMATTVHVIEMGPGNCPVLTALMSSVSYALIPQTTNEIRFVVTKADNICTSPVYPPFVK
jgi:hypothetical protein